MQQDIIITDEMQQAASIVVDKQSHLFITGKAGTGKTVTLNYLLSLLKDKNVIVAAPTGVAAVNAGGATLHSLFNIPLGPISPKAPLKYDKLKYKKRILSAIDILFIDEISMVRSDVLDYIDKVLRWANKNTKPFGGVQLVMFGDLYQLPPVVKEEEANLLKPFYSDFYFFNAKVWDHVGFYVLEFNKIFRQKDPQFIKLLNDIRQYKLTKEDIKYFKENSNKTEIQDYVELCTHKYLADKINLAKLGRSKLARAKAKITGTFSDGSIPCEKELLFRVGARVMTIVNDPNGDYFNGSTGEITGFEGNLIVVKFDNGVVCKIAPYEWKNKKYKLEGDEITQEDVGTIKQYPLRLAWAVTIHKSQGLTFDAVKLNIGSIFTSGQLYVALSRCRTIGGIITDTELRDDMIIENQELMEFEENCKTMGGYYTSRQFFDINNLNFKLNEL
jgi:ATP-dependent exoDNAse (exonuclease V) alpha subunit